VFKKPETKVVKGAAHWASYLINGDASGLSELERIQADAWCDRELEDGEQIVDCGEPFFSWSFGLYTGCAASGGDLVEYSIL
jgi:hypothetical protein